MSRRPADRSTVDALRRAWAQADSEEPAGPAGSEAPDADRIWRAVAGELPAAEVRALADEAARDAEVAQAWRLARELHAASAAGEAGGRVLRFPRLTAPLRWAVAATLALGLGLGLWLRSAPEEPLMRGGEAEPALAPRVPEGASLPRGAFVLRWTAMPAPEARYTLRLTTARLELVAEVRDLATAEYRLPAEALAGLPAGSTLFWQVDARLPDGRVVSSPAYAVVLREGASDP